MPNINFPKAHSASFRKSFLCVLMLTFFFNRSASAQWTDDPDNPLIICDTTGTQKTVHTVSDKNGGSFVFWIDNRNGDADGAIYGQHVNADGVSLWTSSGKSIIQTVQKRMVDFKVA